MEQWKKRKKTVTGFIIFLLFMWACTLISKSIYASRLPRVTVKNPEKKFIEHIVESEGIVKQGGEQAIHVETGLRVKNIFVHIGDTIEESTELFQLDTEDLKRIIKDKELEIAKIDYRISDINKNKELLEQKEQLQLDRAKEDYEAAGKRADSSIDRANTARGEAEADLAKHNDNPPDITSEEDRQKACDKYNNWVKREKELIKKVEEVIKSVTLLETPNEDGTDKTLEQEAEINTVKDELQKYREMLASHESNKVSQPDFSSEDLAKEAWKSNQTSLARAVEQAGYGQDDAYLNKEDVLRDAQRSVDDITTPEQADSTIAIYRMEQQQKADELQKYQEILEQDGLVASTLAGTVTGIGVRVGERTPDTAAIICADSSMPYLFGTTFNKEQKKYINQADEVNITFPGEGKQAVTVWLDYLAESQVSPGTYEGVINLPEGAGVLGMSGTLTKIYQGESYNICVPVQAVHRVNQSVFVYVVGTRKGILGQELYAEQIFVSIADENDRYAAIEESVLTKDMEVIVSATESFSKGDVIRYE